MSAAAATRILLVDDEEELLWSLAERLRKARRGAQVETAQDGGFALEMLRRDRFDILVTDIRMPRLGGLELVVAARALRPDLPVVVMTAFPTSDVLVELRNGGSIEYIEKPFDFARFLETLDRALTRRCAGFSGEVIVQTLPDVVQLYALSNISGALHVQAAPHEGVVWFERGTIPHAEAGPLAGAEAFYEIMSWPTGAFSMRPNSVPPRRTITDGWAELVMESCRRTDEKARAGAPDIAADEVGWNLAFSEPEETGSAPDSAVAIETPAPADAPAPTQDKESTNMANVKDSLTKLESIDGFIGTCLADSDSGMVLGAVGGNGVFNLEVAGATNTEVVRAKRKAAKALGLKDDIEDILITLGKQYHLIRPLRRNPALFVYIALDRTRANLGMARLTLADVEKELTV